MTNEKEYVLKRYNGGNPRVIVRITDDGGLFVRMYHLRQGQTRNLSWDSDVYFSSATALYKGEYGFWNGVRKIFGRIPKEERLLMRMKYEANRLTADSPKDRATMLKLIRGVDNLISTLNGRTI